MGMKKIVIGALVAAVFALELRKAHAGALSCGPGSTFRKMSLADAQAMWGTFASWPAIAEQIKRYGGTCVRSVDVQDAGTRPADDAGDDDTEGMGDPDPYLITHPWQLP